MLGGGPTCLACNTRPVMIYTCGGGNNPWSMPTTKDSTATCDGVSGTCSSVFRVEKIEGNCCTFRVLQDNPDTTSLYPYVATNSVFTMSLDCICVLRCLTDTYVECILGIKYRERVGKNFVAPSSTNKTTNVVKRTPAKAFIQKNNMKK